MHLCSSTLVSHFFLPASPVPASVAVQEEKSGGEDKRKVKIERKRGGGEKRGCERQGGRKMEKMEKGRKKRKGEKD